MDGAQIRTEIHIDGSSLDRLMPMHLCLSVTGHVSSCGPTLRKLFPEISLLGMRFFELFEMRRPSGITSLADLQRRAGERLHLSVRGHNAQTFRGIATPLADGQGMLVNLSFGIGIIDAVRAHSLTDSDFSATDLAVEMLYLVEAKSAVMDELRQLNCRLQGAKSAAEEQALTDTLTGLRNRRALDLELERATDQSTVFGLMHIDLDFFKAVNDSFGHAAGDHVLRKVARALAEETRDGDTVARVGGDEFVVVLPGLIDPASLKQIADRIIARLSTPTEFDGQTCRVSASIGMAISTFYARPTPDQLLGDADQALYASKHAGRGRARIFHPNRHAALAMP